MTAPSNAELLDLIDAELISLLAVAYFGPAEQGTASSVEQACAAEILLFRLRSARRAVADLREAYGLKSPARPVPTTTPPGGLGSTPVRREPAGAAVVPVPMGRPGGPVMPPGATGEASAPGLAGADARAGGAVAPESTPGAPFSMPARVGLPEFQTGAALLRGASC